MGLQFLRRLGMGIVVVVLGGYVLLLALVFFSQRKLLYYPDDSNFAACGSERGLQSTALPPDRAGGIEIRYHSRMHENPVASIIVFHGNAGAACDRIAYQEFFSALAVNWVFVEYPGYSGSSMPTTQETILESSLAAFRFAKETMLRDHPVVLLGESLGTGVATFVASHHSVAGLVLVSPYTSILDVASKRFWFLPVRLLLRDTYPSQQWAQDVRAPVLVLHGSKDTVIDISYGRQQARAFGDQARLVELPNSGHNDWMLQDPELAREAMADFFKSIAAQVPVSKNH